MFLPGDLSLLLGRSSKSLMTGLGASQCRTGGPEPEPEGYKVKFLKNNKFSFIDCYVVCAPKGFFYVLVSKNTQTSCNIGNFGRLFASKVNE